jgi:hypothetical protein
MSTVSGKVVVDGTSDGPQGPHFHLRFLQARREELVGRPFQARYSPTAAWIDELELSPETPGDIAAAFQ